MACFHYHCLNSIALSDVHGMLHKLTHQPLHIQRQKSRPVVPKVASSEPSGSVKQGLGFLNFVLEYHHIFMFYYFIVSMLLTNRYSYIIQRMHKRTRTHTCIYECVCIEHIYEYNDKLCFILSKGCHFYCSFR